MREDTRDLILEAATETMTLYGLARLTLADVAKHAHLSRQTLYRSSRVGKYR
ncbi:MAG: TetR family transcriptional regulator [Actinomycetota bacterium]